jgi:alternate signal-mediated exported protein
MSRKEIAMNKLTKGAIATAAGIALLLGGAGTFALWNGQTTIAGGTISTGQLSIASTGSAVWKDISTTVVGGTTFDPATQKIVPGDVLQLTQQVTLTTTGKNLKANFTFDPLSITTDPALTAALTEGLTATVVPATGAAALTSTGSNSYSVVPGTASSTVVNVVFTVTFAPGTTGTVGQNIGSALNLTGLSYTLTQVRP